MGKMGAAASTRPALAQLLLVWVLLFLICLGLGYSTLNRYDPRNVNPDTIQYHNMVTGGPRAAEGHMRFRVLVPLLARPFYRVASGRVGSWNPVFAGLLVANSLLTASTAFLLLLVAYAQLGDYVLALLGAALYLLNFATANLRLAGLIDSGEGFFLMAIVWSLFSGRMYLLPLWAVLGALSKETFVPFAIVFGGTWWLVANRRDRASRNQLIWIGAMAFVALSTVTVLQAVISGHLIWPWAFAWSMDSRSNYAANLVASLLDRNFWYVYAWLLPLGVWRLHRLPSAWVWASATTALSAFALNAYYEGQPGTVGRAVFSIAGPLLSLSVAILLGSASPAGVRDRMASKPAAASLPLVTALGHEFIGSSTATQPSGRSDRQ